MKRPLIVHPRADIDQLECFTYLAQKSPDAARRFLEAIEASLRAIADNRDVGHRYLAANRQDEDWRYRRVPGFQKYLIFYRVTAAETEVVRIVHGSRDLESIFRVL